MILLKYTYLSSIYLWLSFCCVSESVMAQNDVRDKYTVY